jgi:hypothetical protein
MVGAEPKELVVVERSCDEHGWGRGGRRLGVEPAELGNGSIVLGVVHRTHPHGFVEQPARGPGVVA